MTDIDRRTLIGVACLGCATLAGCGSSSDASGSTASSAPAGSPSSGTAASSAPPAATATPSATAASPSGSTAGKGPALATLSAIPVGSAVAAKTADGKAVIVARPTETTAVAFSAKCTHAGCTVNVAGTSLKCPCHGSVFEATTGKVVNPPARTPLPAVPVTVTGGQVFSA